MADASSRVDVWLGSSLGLIKGVSLDPLRCTNYLPGGLALAQTDKSCEMLCMCREFRNESMAYIGLRSGVVQAFDCAERRFTAECDVTAGVGTLVGVAKQEQILITCTDQGALSYWPPGEEKWEVDVGPRASCMTASPSAALQVATGGRETPLKLWDGHHTDSPLFTAKNVCPDKLGLRVPVWVNEVGFTPDSGPQPVLVTGTGYGQVRLYDTRAQRRPLFSTEYGTEPITALDLTPDGRYCVVGNGVGELARFDLRKGGVVSRYKGCGGAVAAAQVSGDGSLLAVCGLDRYLRVYRLERPTLLHQLYLKLQCRCLLFSHSFSRTDSDGAVGREGRGEVRKGRSEGGEEEGDGEGSDGEDVWATMETVGVESERAGGKRKLGPELLPADLPHSHKRGKPVLTGKRPTPKKAVKKRTKSRPAGHSSSP